MKITLDVKEGLVLLAHDTKLDKPVRTQDDMYLKVDAQCSIQLVFEKTQDKPDKPMQASTESGASGSLSFA